MSKKDKRSITHVDIFDDWYDNPHQLTKKEYRAIAELCNQMLVQYIIQTGDSVVLPAGLGRLRIRKIPTKDWKWTPMDINHYAQTGEKIAYRNKHSEGYLATFLWDKDIPYGKFNRRHFIKLKPTRANKKLLVNAIRDKNTMPKYYE